MKVGGLATVIFGALIAFSIASFAGVAHEEGDDGVPNVLDNCTEVANAGALDCDTDQDGYGNACDCDLNQPTGSLTCTAADLALWKQAFKNGTPLHADHNCSGSITAADLAIWKLRFKNQATQFRSGLHCAGAGAGHCPN